MEDKTRFDDDHAFEASPRRTGWRRLVAATMSVAAVGAVAAMLWPAGGLPAPQSASAFAGTAAIQRVVADAIEERLTEERKSRPSLQGAAPTFAAPATAKKKPANGKPVDGKPVDGKPTDGKKKPAKGKQATASGTKGSGSEVPVPASEAVVSSPPSGADGRAAKQVARRFAEAFVVYETGGVDAKVRDGFRLTTTKELAKALLQRPPRQPAAVEVPQAKVVTVVAGPSKGSAHEVSVSLLRVGVTSELRLQLEQGPGKKWQVTNVLG